MKRKIISIIFTFSFAIFGALTSMSNSSIKEAKATSIDLKDLLSFDRCDHHDYNAIAEYDIYFNYGATIFGDNGHFYYNDHRQSFLREDGSYIDIGKAVKINGKTLEYYLSVSSDEGLKNNNAYFPLNVGDIYSPVATEFNQTFVGFKINPIYFNDILDMEITFVGGLFEGYNADSKTSFTLSSDVTFYATLDTTNAEASGIKFVKVLEEEEKEFSINSYNYEERNKYYYIAIETSINAAIDHNIYQFSWLLDHYEYLNQYILVNNQPALYYNALARANYYDFNANGQLNDAYNTVHPTGDVNKNYDRPIQIEVVVETNKVTFRINIAKQVFIDIPNYGDSFKSIGFKKGMKFITSYADKITRYDSTYTLYWKEEFNKLTTDNKTKEFNITGMSIFYNAQVVAACLNTTLGIDDNFFGYNISDKDYCKKYQDYILINGKTIKEINNAYDTNHNKIPLDSYDLPWFNAYGAGNVSPLTVPIIVIAQEGKIYIAFHPTYFNELAFPPTITIKEGFKALSDDGIEYAYIGESYTATLSYDESIVAKDSLLNNLALYSLEHSECALKNVKQAPTSFIKPKENLIYSKDDNNNAALYFSNGGSTNSEIRFYLGSNTFKNETVNFNVTNVSFKYKLKDNNNIYGTESGLTYEGGEEKTISSSNKTSYMLQYVANNGNKYYNYDMDLISDSAWHEFTLDVTCPNVNGINIKLFKFDGEILISDIKVTTKHLYIVTERVDPTCIEDGYEIKTCSSCGESKKEILTKLGHTYQENYNYDENNHWHECSCGDKKDIEEHHYIETSRVAATCIEDGSITYTCVCGASKTESILAGHSYKENYNYDENNHWHECSCGDKKDIETHHYVETSRVEATTKAPGSITYTCTCGAIKVETISQLPSNSTGCGGSIITSSTLISMLSFIGLALFLNKKKNI